MHGFGLQRHLHSRREDWIILEYVRELKAIILKERNGASVRQFMHMSMCVKDEERYDITYINFASRHRQLSLFI